MRDKPCDLYLCDSRRQYRRDPWRLIRVVTHKYFVKLSLSLETGRRCLNTLRRSQTVHKFLFPFRWASSAPALVQHLRLSLLPFPLVEPFYEVYCVVPYFLFPYCNLFMKCTVLSLTAFSLSVTFL